MRKSICLLCFTFASFASTLLFAQTENKNFLVVNPGGHKGQIRELRVTADKKKVVTASYDKSIKVWDFESGELEREFLGEIGSGSEGMIYHIDLSDDDKMLAVGGWFGKHDASETLGDIRVYDFQSGKLLFLLRGHENVIENIEFVNGNTQLLSSDADANIWLWDLKTKTVIRKYNQHDKKLDSKYGSDEVKDFAVNGNVFVTGDQYGRIKLWDLNRNDTISTDRYFETFQADGVDISSDGNFIAATVDTFITIYNNKLVPIAEASSVQQHSFVRFSPDGKKLLTGCYVHGDEHKLYVYALEDTAWVNYTEFTQFDNSFLAGDWIDNETFALGGDWDDAVVIVKLNGEDKDPKILKRMAGTGNEFYAASLEESILSYATKWTANFGLSDINKQMDLQTREIGKPDLRIKINKPRTEYGDYKLARFSTEEELNAGLDIIYKGKIIDSIILEYHNGSRHNVFSFLNEKYFASGQSYGLLKAYDVNGLQAANFIGHTGDTWGISVTADGKRMVSANSDRTIKIWSLEKIGKRDTAAELPSVSEIWKQFEIHETFYGIAKKLKVEKDADTRSVQSWEKVIKTLAANKYPTRFLEKKFAEFTAVNIYPIASIFVTEKGDWLIWDEKGYFTGSRKATKYVGYHVNKGNDREAKYYPFEQFDLKFNRPDIIMQELGIASAEMIRAYEYAYQKRLKKMGVTEQQLSDDIHLPEVNVNNYSFNEQTGKLTIKVEATDEKYPLNRLNIFVDDVPVYGSAGKDISGSGSTKFSGEFTVDVIPGKNKIQVSVLNEKGAESLKETFSVISRQSGKPSLYIVSLGVSNYKDASFNLNYAAKDADDVVHFFEKSDMYSKVYIDELTNEKVTKENILKIKADFLSKAQPNDVVIFFVAGHGVLNKNMDYYFATYDLNFHEPETKGITFEELESLLDGIKPYRKLFFMDSCHSGELDKDEYAVAVNDATSTAGQPGEVVFRNGGNIGVVSQKRIGLSQSSQLLKELFTDLRRGSGATMISSAGGAEFAMESKEWKNGLFTYCLLNGLKTKAADDNGDGMIMLSELQSYVQKKVTELSGGKQLPTFRRENLEFDYRVW